MRGHDSGALRIAVIVAALLVNATVRGGDPVSVILSPQGLNALVWRGHNFVRPENDLKAGQVEAAVQLHGQPVTIDEAPHQSALTTGQTVQQQFSWGDLRITYRTDGSEAEFTVQATNRMTGQTIESLSCRLLDFTFPGQLNPPGWQESDPPSALAKEGPATLAGRFGDGAVALVNDLEANQVSCRWGSRDHGSYPVYVETNRPIFPGDTLTMQVALCFGSKDASADDLAKGRYERFREQHPPRLNWSDRRPIGSLFLAKVNMKWPGNPRGWFSDGTLDLRTDAGRAELQDRLMAYADGSIRLLQEMGAQGMILWDVEGQEFPQGVSTYAGDPTQLPRLAPEMDAVADEFFQRFTGKGLRTGVCLRCQQIRYRANGSFYQSPYADENAILEGLDRKMAYAERRWGCSLFYVDSNGGDRGVYDPEIFRRLQARHPNSLIAPEFGFTPYWACTAPYRELRKSAPWAEVHSTPHAITQVYPEGLSVINVADGDIYGNFFQLVEAVKRGDILLYRSWMRSREYPDVQAILRTAGRAK